MSNSKRWQRAADFFDLALRGSVSNREAFRPDAARANSDLDGEAETSLDAADNPQLAPESVATEWPRIRLAPGTRLGPYQILTFIGSGGMGEVYKGRDTRLNRTVAIKSLAARHADDPLPRRRFEREAQAVAALAHPHICVLHDIGQHGEIDFLVMEYLAGETLASRLKKGPLPIDQVLGHAIEIADALDNAHSKGIVHRDLKPGNLMLTSAGIKLLDFGLAQLSVSVTAPSLPSASASGPVTNDGAIRGTLPYMAPELFEGCDADARSDLFALGATIFEMATGRPAFTGNSQSSLVAAIRDRHAESVAASRF